MESNVVYAPSSQTQQQGPGRRPSTYDSGWFSVSNQSSSNVVFEHRLGVVPGKVTVVFSPDREISYPLFWPSNPGKHGNPVSIMIDSHSVTLAIFHKVPLHAYWDAYSGVWTCWRSGYFRVIASP